MVLFVSVSTVLRPTNVSVDVGRVNVPELIIVDITGAVNVLFVSVCVVDTVATDDVSTNIVPDVVIGPPSNPKPVSISVTVPCC